MKNELGRLVATAVERGLIERVRPPSREDSRFVDGFQYGAMFSDGSVLQSWSGPAQREQAVAYIHQLRWNPPSRARIALARRALLGYTEQGAAVCTPWEPEPGWPDPRELLPGHPLAPPRSP